MSNLKSAEKVSRTIMEENNFNVNIDKLQYILKFYPDFIEKEIWGHLYNDKPEEIKNLEILPIDEVIEILQKYLDIEKQVMY